MVSCNAAGCMALDPRYRLVITVGGGEWRPGRRTGRVSVTVTVFPQARAAAPGAGAGVTVTVTHDPGRRARR